MTRRGKGVTSLTSGRKSGEDSGEDADYSVGYGKPPAKTRFKPGTSGNPKGRPKGKRNLATDIRNVYTDEVIIREGEKTYRITRLEALLRKQLERAFRGDERATLTACKIAAQLGLFNVEKEKVEVDSEKLRLELSLLTDAELAVVERFYTALVGTDGSKANTT